MSGSTIYVGNLDHSATPRDLRNDFEKFGTVSDIWVARKPPGFAYIEYNDERSAKNAIREMDGRYILNQKVRVELSRRGKLGKDSNSTPQPTRSENRIFITGFRRSTDWRDLKDWLRTAVEPCFVDINADGVGIAEYYTERDMNLALEKLDDTRFQGEYVRLKRDSEGRDREKDRGRDRERDRDRERERERPRDRISRSRSRSRGRDDRRRDRDREGDRDRDRERERDRPRDKERVRDTDRERDRERERDDKERSRKSHRDRSPSPSPSPSPSKSKPRSPSPSPSPSRRRSPSP